MESSFYPFKFKLPHIHELNNHGESILKELNLYALSLSDNKIKKQIVESLVAFHAQSATIKDFRKIYIYALNLQLKDKNINDLIRPEWLLLSQKCKSPLENFNVKDIKIDKNQNEASIKLCCYYHLFVFIHGSQSSVAKEVREEIENFLITPNLLLGYRLIDSLHQKFIFSFLQYGGIESLPFSLKRMNIFDFLLQLGITVSNSELEKKPNNNNSSIATKTTINDSSPDSQEADLKIILFKDVLSVRSYNVCVDNKLNTLNDLNNHFSKFYTFTNLPNCGRKSNKELIEFCNQKNSENHLDQITKLGEESAHYSDKRIEELLANLTLKDWETFLLNLLTSSKTLSKRNENILLSITKNKIKHSILKNLIKAQYSPLQIKNIGEKSGIELSEFIRKKIDWLYKIIQLNEAGELQSIKDFRYFKFFIKFQLNISLSNFSVSEKDFELRKVKLFALVSQLCFSQSFFSSENEYYIFVYGTGFDKRYSKKNLEQLGVDLGMTRERVRQIKKKLLKSTFQRLSLFKDILSYADKLFALDQPLVILNDLLLTAINANGDTTLTRRFIGRFINSIYDGKSVLGIDFLYSGSLNNRGYTSAIISEDRMLHNFYIIDEVIKDQVKFKELFIDLGKKMNEKIKENIKLEKRDYLKPFIKEIDSDNLEIVSIILQEEFSRKIHRGKNMHYIPLEITEEFIIINRNTKWKHYEYVYKVLEDLGEPSHKDIIRKRLKEMFPEINIKSVQGAVLNNSDIFISFGRSSTYGLKKWEAEGNVKGGTIREIIQDYLENWQTPRHINDITQYVQRFRESTNSNSIFYNLKIMNPDKNPFLFFRGGLIGLKTKKYYDKDKLISSTSPSSLEELIDDFF